MFSSHLFHEEASYFIMQYFHSNLNPVDKLRTSFAILAAVTYKAVCKMYNFNAVT